MSRVPFRPSAAALLAAASLLAGCRVEHVAGAPAVPAAAPLAARAQAARHAAATLRDAAGADVGEARLVEDATGRVHLTVHVRGVTPGLHGLHLHTAGSCDPANGFAAAGGHFNPTGREHGHHNLAGFHAGDLPNLEVTPAGVGRLTIALEQFTLGALNDANGTALVLHANEDDRRTNTGPSGPGNSGARIACGALRFE
jgi:Cu-Zn family superoxide dismutase